MMAIELDPNLASAYNNLGAGYATKGQFGKAIFNYNRAIALNPRFALAYFNRGSARMVMGNQMEACSDLKKACDLTPCPNNVMTEIMQQCK